MDALKIEKEHLQLLLTECSKVPIYLRPGQHMFNMFYERYPNIIDKVRGTQYDPFHDNNNIGRFISFILRYTEC